eukprot:CAMPEP_0198713506 /NCGR_PEP_ID=MMETSP1471-20131121/5782_1 /TAXON_ID=41880 /ORGANISM="Pycnococcus provasolii, Strain RCC733" /LENGTH=118 /DNA_ID=CAMNT_0044473597 /DNA_START=29 /DNA_END=385 /DNA_ORIENTATION=-
MASLAPAVLDSFLQADGGKALRARQVAIPAVWWGEVWARNQHGHEYRTTYYSATITSFSADDKRWSFKLEGDNENCKDTMTTNAVKQYLQGPLPLPQRRAVRQREQGAGAGPSNVHLL